MLKLGMSTACFYPSVIEDGAARIAQLGVRYAELFLNTESEFAPEFSGRLRAQLDEAGVEVVSVHPFTSPMEGQLLLSEYERRTEDGLRQYQRYFETARLLGAQYFTLHGERDTVPDTDAKDFARKMSAYRRLCGQAAACGLVVAQENVAWCKSQHPEYLRRLRQEVPGLGFTLDIKQAHRAGRHWEEYLDAMGDRLCNVHINDFDGTHSCLLPGEGAMDYGAFFQRLRDSHYNGHAIIEVYSSNYRNLEQVAEAVNCLRAYTDPD